MRLDGEDSRRRDGVTERGEPKGGWRAQSFPLKVLLVVSLACLVIGVYRCSGEFVPSQGTRSIRVERATVDVADSLIAISSDSLASVATRMFVRGLRAAHAGEVTIDESPTDWAVARLHLRSASGGRVELIGTATSAISGRRLSAVSVEDAPDRLREMTATAAGEMAGQLALPDTSASEGR